MTSSTDTTPAHVGEVVSLAPLGQDVRARILSRSWSPALGEIIRLRPEGHGRPEAMIMLYGDMLSRLFPPADVAALR